MLTIIFVLEKLSNEEIFYAKLQYKSQSKSFKCLCPIASLALSSGCDNTRFVDRKIVFCPQGNAQKINTYYVFVHNSSFHWHFQFV